MRALPAGARIAVAVIAAAMCAPAAAALGPPAFSDDDYFRLVGLGDPQLSPDGARIARHFAR